MTAHVTTATNGSNSRPTVTAASKATKARLFALCRILDAVAEQRDVLTHRIWREDLNDTLLEADCQTWCELTQSLADFLEARRA